MDAETSSPAKSQAGKPDLQRWLHATGSVLLVLTIVWTYFPALAHPPREDQWSYLVDTYDEDRFVPLILNTYSYTRTREVLPGDYPLFRPVFFALMAAEKALFGPRYAYWQAFGIALHLAVVFALLRLMLRLESMVPSAAPAVRGVRMSLAYLVALFFGVNFAGTEMVIWCHIHGYMLYVLLMLGGLLLVLDDLCGESTVPRRAWRVGGAFVLTLLAAFTYETGSIYAMILGLALSLGSFRRRQFRQGVVLAGLFASILILYQTANRLDQLSHPDAKPDITAADLFAQALNITTTPNALRYTLFTLWQPFFPTVPKWELASRLQIQEPVMILHRYARMRPSTLISFAAMGLGGIFALVQLGRLLAGRDTLRSITLPALLVGIFGLHMTVIVLGRMNLRPCQDILSRNSYYAYVPLLLLLIGLYYLWIRLPPISPRWSCTVLFLLGGGYATVATWSAHKVHAMNIQIEKTLRPLANQIDCLQGLIDRHGVEPGFAFSFHPPLFDAMQSYHGLTTMEALFFPYFDHDRPTHVVCGTLDCMYGMAAEEYEARQGDAYYRKIPKVVRKSTHYMVYEHHGRYFAVQQNRARFSLTRSGFGDLPEGDSVEEVMRHISGQVGSR